MSNVWRLLGSVVVFLAIAEGSVRVFEPTPKLQVVRGGGQGKHELSMLHGQPVWAEPGTTERIQADCSAPQRAMLLGSSILYGTGYAPEDSVGIRAQQALDAAHPETWCVHNLAQAGFTSRGKLALAKEWLPTLQPDVVVWELWTNEPGGFTLLGEDAYNLTGIATDAEGYPVAPLPVPGALHHALFRQSKFWWYLTLSSLTRPRGAAEAAWDELRDDTLPQLAELAQQHESRLVFLAVPQLDRPFRESAEEPYWQYAPVREWAQEQGHLFVDLADRFRDEDHLALRHDPCCHYNADGQTRVGGLLAEIVQSPEQH